MAELTNLDGRRLRNHGARLLRQAREDVQSALLLVGFLTCVTAVRAAVSRPAAEGVLIIIPYPVHMGALAWAFFGGLGTMIAANWVAGDVPGRRATGQVILYAALLPMVVAVGLSNDSGLFFFNIIFRALA